MKNYNIQRSNVGNLGDIIKHTALLYLANHYFSQDFHYIDTHCFLMETSIANIQWREQTLHLARQYRGYKDYYELQQPMVDKGRYWCSSGMIYRFTPVSHLYLSESNAKTHKILKTQIDDEQKVHLATDYSHWLRGSHEFQSSPSLLLFDPFAMDETLWQDLQILMQDLQHRHVVVLVFHYCKSPYQWPLFDQWFCQSLALQPFNMACYSRDPIDLKRLGWS